MKAPLESKKIKKGWIKYMLEQYLSQTDPTIKYDAEIKQFTIIENEAGLGFNSELVSLDVEAILKKDGDPQDIDPSCTKYPLKVKFLSVKPGVREINKRFKSNVKEHAIYSEVIRDLNNFQASLCEDKCRIHVPEFIYGKCSEKEFVLVMRNIKSQGYDLRDKYKGLDYAHLKTATDQIAKFHAVSYAFNKSQNLLKKYPFFKYNEEVNTFVLPFFEGVLDSAVEVLTAKEKVDIAKRINDSKTQILEKLSHSLIPGGEEPTCLIHGDFWSNNLMFKHAEDRENDMNDFNCMIFDWGNVSWAQPLYDLQYLIYTSTTLETRRNHLDSILRHYYDTFTESASTVGSPVTNWTYEDFQRAWHRLDYFGLALGLLISMGTMSKSNSQGQPQSASCLDHRICSPIKWFVRGMETGMAKALLPIVYSPSGRSLLKLLSGALVKPMKKELLSGKNEPLLTRFIETFCDADERGLFNG